MKKVQIKHTVNHPNRSKRPTPEKCDPAKFRSYHITFTPPFKNEHVDWPDGHWAVYAIGGEEIARCIRFEDGKVVERHSWPGYLGGSGSLEGAVELIADHQASTQAS